jgi:hypothetical protein
MSLVSPLRDSNRRQRYVAETLTHIKSRNAIRLALPNGRFRAPHADLTARFDVAFELRDPAAPLQSLAPDRLLGTIHAVYLKDLLGQVHTHTSKLHDDSSSFRDW